MKDPYKNVASWYDKILDPFNNGLRQIGLKMFPVTEGMNILDMGCGTGAHLKIYQEKGCNLFGIDLSPAMLNMAKKKLAPDAKLELYDATNTSFPDGFFDLIYSMTVLHEMDEEVRIGVLKEADRILKPNGRILFIDFHNGPIRKLKGVVSKIVITFFEMVAGKRHFKNYRHFIRNGALPRLIKSRNFEIVDQKIVAGGTFGLFLLRKANT